MLTFIAIILLLLLFSRKFRESFKAFLKYFPEFYDSIIIKNKDSFFKITLILIVIFLIIGAFLEILFSIFEVPDTITWNFLSDFLSAAIWLYLLRRVISILFNQKIIDYFKIDFSILKGFTMAILLIALVLGISYVTYPLASQLPTFEIFDKIRQEIFQKPKTALEFILLVLSISIMPAFVEEIFFRGVLYKNIRKKYDVLVSVIIVTVVFYLFHLDPQMIIFLVTANIALCLSYEYTKSLEVPFVVHLGINFSSLLFFLNNPKVP